MNLEMAVSTLRNNLCPTMVNFPSAPGATVVNFAFAPGATVENLSFASGAMVVNLLPLFRLSYQGICVPMDHLAKNNSSSLYQYLQARENLQLVWASVQRRFKVTHPCIDFDNTILNNEIVEEIPSFGTVDPDLWDAVPSPGSIESTETDWRELHPSEALQLLNSAIRWLNEVIHLLLRYFAHLSFPYQLTLREKKWSVLHGSHPPKALARLAVRPRGTREGLLHATCSPSSLPIK